MTETTLTQQNEKITNIYLKQIDHSLVLFDFKTVQVSYFNYVNVGYLFDVNQAKQVGLTFQLINGSYGIFQNVVIEFDPITLKKKIYQTNLIQQTNLKDKYIKPYFIYHLGTSLKSGNYYYMNGLTFKKDEENKLNFVKTYYDGNDSPNGTKQKITTKYYDMNHFQINNKNEHNKIIKQIDKNAFNNGEYKIIEKDEILHDSQDELDFGFGTLNDGFNINSDKKQKTFSMLHNFKNNNKQSKVCLVSRDDSFYNHRIKQKNISFPSDSNNDDKIIFGSDLYIKELPFENGNQRQLQFIGKYQDYKYIYSLGGGFFFIGKLTTEEIQEDNTNKYRTKMIYDIIYLTDTHPLDTDEVGTYEENKTIKLPKGVASFSANILGKFIKGKYDFYYKLNNQPQFKKVNDIKQITKFSENKYFNKNGANTFNYKLVLKQNTNAHNIIKIKSIYLAFYGEEQTINEEE